MAEWKDVTTYPRGDRAGREATAFELEITPRFRICVLRGHINWPPEQWLLSCVALRYIHETPLDATTEALAKREGFNRAWDYLGSLRDAMLEADHG